MCGCVNQKRKSIFLWATQTLKEKTLKKDMRGYYERRKRGEHIHISKEYSRK